MAESLMAPPPEVDKSAVDAGYGDDFEGFAELVSSDGRSSSGQGELVPRPDGRPHAQKQFVNPSMANPASNQQHRHPTAAEVPASGEEPGISRRVAAGSALADARRLAEGSGMLASGEPVAQPAPASVESSQLDSPFKVSADQHQSVTDPLGRQVTPAVDSQTTPSAPPAPSKPKVSTFQPDIEAAPQAPVVPTEAIAPDKPGSLESGGQNRGDDRGRARGPFLSRLQQFSEIIRRDLDAKAMFLIDNEGQILLDEVENPKLIQVARTLANASYRASRQTAGVAAVGNLHVKIGASATLEVIPVESHYGLLILGVIFPAPLGAERVRQVAEVLHKTVEPRL